MFIELILFYTKINVNIKFLEFIAHEIFELNIMISCQN